MSEMLIISARGDRAAELAVLADEMTEDPRCSLVLRGLTSDGASAVLVTTWDADVAAEVAGGLADNGWSVQRLEMA